MDNIQLMHTFKTGQRHHCKVLLLGGQAQDFVNISKKFPKIKVHYTRRRVSKILTVHEDALQDIHVAGAHWVLISTLGCKNGEVNVYDSFHKTIGADRAKKIVRLNE